MDQGVGGRRFSSRCPADNSIGEIDPGLREEKDISSRLKSKQFDLGWRGVGYYRYRERKNKITQLKNYPTLPGVYIRELGSIYHPGL